MKALAVPIGSLVVHTDDPWGDERPNQFGQILADLAAVALSTGRADGRIASTADTVGMVLDGTTVIATAVGILAEYFALDIDHARSRLYQLARAHRVSPSVHAAAIVDAQARFPHDAGRSAALHLPAGLAPPPHIGL